MSFFCGACQMQVSDMTHHRASYHPHETLRQQIEDDLRSTRDRDHELLEALGIADQLDQRNSEGLWLTDWERSILRDAATVLRDLVRREWDQ